MKMSGSMKPLAEKITGVRYFTLRMRKQHVQFKVSTEIITDVEKITLIE